MDLENGTEVYASTFLKLNIYRDCDFINKYLMTKNMIKEIICTGIICS